LLTGSLALLLLCCGAVSSSKPNQLTTQEESAGWQLLFNGRTTSGWKAAEKLDFPHEVWSVEDGCLKATPSSISGADLISERMFEDFELRFEWRLSPGGNSGVKYLVQEGRRNPDQERKKKWAIAFSIGSLLIALVLGVFLRGRRVQSRYWAACVLCFVLAIGLSLLGIFGFFWLSRPWGNAIGLEFQLLDEQQPGVLSKNRTSGALYDLISPSSNPVRPAGEFNQGRIVVRGNHLEHWVNGVQVLGCKLDSRLLRDRIRDSKFRDIPELANKASGHISLQYHGDEVWFRNIKVRRF
jgi:hypothetical protein